MRFITAVKHELQKRETVRQLQEMQKHIDRVFKVVERSHEKLVTPREIVGHQ